MARHKVVLKQVSLKSDLRNIALTLSSLQGVSTAVAVGVLKTLPYTLVDNCSAEYARKIEQLFKDLGAEMEVIPPLPAVVNLGPEVVATAHKFRLSRGVGWVLGGILLLSAALLYWGGNWLVQQIEAPSEVNTTQQIKKLARKSAGSMEGAKAKISAQLDAKPNDENLKLQKAIVLIGLARQKMDASGWSDYGSKLSLQTNQQEDLFAAPELDSALAILKTLKNSATAKPEAYRWLVEVYLQKGLFDMALEYAQKLVELNNQNVVYWNLLAAVYQEQNQLGPAQSALRRALALDTNHLETLRNLGVLSIYHLGDTLQGLKYLHHYLHQEPGKDMDRYYLRREMMAMVWRQYNPLWQNLGMPQMNFREYESQRVSLQRAVAEEPRNSVLREQLAVLYAAQKMLPEALAELQTATRLNPRQESAWRLQAVVQGELKQWDALLNTLEKSQRNKAKDPFFSKNLALAYEYYKLDSPKGQKYMAEYLAKGGDQYRSKIIRNFSKK